MNGQQLTALGHLCRLPEETAHPRFKTISGDVSLILSLDAGYA